MRPLLAALALLALAGCQQPQPKPPPTAAKPDAWQELMKNSQEAWEKSRGQPMQDWVSCTVSKAKTLATASHETADVVAIAAVQMCFQYEERIRQILGPYARPSDIQEMHNQMVANMTGIIVEFRAAAPGKQKPPSPPHIRPQDQT